MLTLFEDITEELTDLEKEKLVPMLLEKLKSTSIDDPLKGKHLVAWFKSIQLEDAFIKTDEIRLRKMISYARQLCLTEFVICAGSKGYYISRNLNEIDNQIESLEGRRNQLNSVINSLQAQRENLKHKLKKAS